MNFVLVPGAGGQALYWHRVIPELQRVGHKGVPVDMPAADASCGHADASCGNTPIRSLTRPAGWARWS